MQNRNRIIAAIITLSAILFLCKTTMLWAGLADIRKQGVIRHLGIPCARFVISHGDGFSAELVKGFSQYLGLGYEYVPATWETIIPCLTGKTYRLEKGRPHVTGQCPIKGDIIATGLTILPWRKALIDYSRPTFPSGIWLVAPADSPLIPIRPQGSIQADIEQVKSLLSGMTVLSKPGTCLDPALYGFENCGANWVALDRKVYEFVSAMMHREVDCSLTEVADAMIALEKWPGKIKVIGPVSPLLEMGCGFRKSDPGCGTHSTNI